MRNEYGLSLIELMVALTLGLLVTGAIGTLFIQNKSSYSQNDEIGYIQDNGRYALKALSQDLEMVDFWGGFDDPSQIGYYTFNQPSNTCLTYSAYLVNNAMHYKTQPASPETTFPCVANDYSTNPVTSDFLVVKRVKGQATTAGWTDGQVYFRTDLANTRWFYLRGVVNPGTLTSSQTDWAYNLHVYYIDPDYRLIRQTLAPGNPITTPIMRRDVIVEGIEYFHVVYGLDTDRDGAIDQYESNPTDTELGYAFSAQVYVLARSRRAIPGYTNAKSYKLGDIYYPNANDSSVAVNDGYYRRVFSTTVVLRNAYIMSRLSRW